jgi:hypothetical protein
MSQDSTEDKLITAHMEAELTSSLEAPPGFDVIVEGQASMLYDKNEAVFYNKVGYRVFVKHNIYNVM